jgi:hypothetical protein
LGQALFWDKLDPVPNPCLSIYKDLTREIISWLCTSERKSNVYLIAEPQEIAEPRYPPYMMEIPTRARVLATICCYADRLGAQPNFDLDAISGELAARYPAYRHVLTGLFQEFSNYQLILASENSSMSHGKHSKGLIPNISLHHP